MSDAASFCDRLAPCHPLLYGDWEAAVARQGAALTRLLDAHGVRPGAPVLDAACGIRTQTIGLAANAYEVTASDCSPGAIERLLALMQEAGLVEARRLDDVLFQPVLVGRRADAGRWRGPAPRVPSAAAMAPEPSTRQQP